MELNEAVAEISDNHVKRSRKEMADTDKIKTWTNGERAKEQADAIVQAVVADALKALEQGATNEG